MLTGPDGRRWRRAPRPARPSRLAWLLHAVFFVAAATQTAIVPLLPHLGRVYHLAPAATAFLLAAPGLATLAISAPAGILADRFGARRVTVAATALLCLSSLTQALPSYTGLLVGRLGFGIAYGVLWTTGVTWLAHVESQRGTSRLGAVATSAAAGMAAGPGIGGITAQWLSAAAPFIFVGGLAGVVALQLWRHPDPPAVRRVARESLRQMTRVAPRRPQVFGGACALTIVGAIGGVTQLLVPMQLQHAGISVSATGLAFSAAAVVYIVASAFVVRLGQRATTVRFAAIASTVLALSLLPASLDPTTLVVVSVLLVSTVPRAMVSTLAYPLATAAADDDELGHGTVIGLLNGTWAAGLVTAPLLAGAIAGTNGPGPAYLAVVIPAAVGGLWLLFRRGRPAPASQLAAAEPV
jgi:predicted MFS family arabinose efflux permease